MIFMPETKIPAFEFKGREFSRAYLAQGIEDLGTSKPSRELGPKSLTLGYQAALFEAALLRQLGIEATPADVVSAAVKHYGIITSEDNKYRGNWTSTIFDYDTDFGRNAWLPDGYERIGVIEGSRWINKDGIWAPQKKRDVIAVDMPPEGWAALTKDGLYQTTGAAFETVKDKKEAARRLENFAMSRGLGASAAKSFAERNVSYFYRRGRNTGYSPVYRHFDDNGPFRVTADWDADGRGGDLGSFPASSSGKKK